MFWTEEFPHDIHVSVLLSEEKIIDWKIGRSYWDTPFEPTIRISTDINSDKLRISRQMFVAHDSKEHQEIFEVKAIDWMKNYDFHEDFFGNRPF